MGRVRELREALGLSKSELGRRAGVNQTTISQIESGRFIPYEVQVKKLARALGVKPDELGIIQPDEARTA